MCSLRITNQDRIPTAGPRSDAEHQTACECCGQAAHENTLRHERSKYLPCKYIGETTNHKISTRRSTVSSGFSPLGRVSPHHSLLGWRHWFVDFSPGVTVFCDQKTTPPRYANLSPGVSLFTSVRAGGIFSAIFEPAFFLVSRTTCQRDEWRK